LILVVASFLSCVGSIPPGTYLQEDACSTIRLVREPPEPRSQWVDVVRWCVPWAGADLETAIADDTPLMRALSPEAVKVLAEAGADVNARDRSGRTVLMRLAANACGPGSNRPQYCQSRHHDIPGAVLQLLEYDVDVDATDPRGRTATDLAAADGQTEMVGLLRERLAG
jgi:hypothetical protein